MTLRFLCIIHIILAMVTLVRDFRLYRTMFVWLQAYLCVCVCVCV